MFHFFKGKTFLGLLIISLSFWANAKSSAGRQVKCLALNVYFEARGEPHQGKLAVGMVTYNRARSRFFQGSICGVVYAKSQFSWTFDRYSNAPVAGPVWSTSLSIANKIIARQTADPTGNASHFYNPAKASPAWARKFKKTARIGNHNFHRMPGFADSQTISLAANDEFVATDSILGNGGRFYNTGLNENENLNSQDLDPADKEQVVNDSGYNEFLDFIDDLPGEGEVPAADESSDPEPETQKANWIQNENQNQKPSSMPQVWSL